MFLEELKNITTFIFDVDGVLTNGTVFCTESGELLRTFNVKDGYAIQCALKQGFKVCIISGGKGEAMTKRFENLGLTDIYLGVADKLPIFETYVKKHNTAPTEVLYMGDDLPDLPVMKKVALATCPADATEEIKTISHYISPVNGGQGAVRDIIEKVLKVQEKWIISGLSAAEASK
jgi:3-deoxy-D-manno-octulosonate 8-phosphate phosphatase (KDO 8-P phosphatase)